MNISGVREILAAAIAVAFVSAAACVGDDPTPSLDGERPADAGTTDSAVDAAPGDAVVSDASPGDAAALGADAADATSSAAIRCAGTFCRGGDVCCVETTGGDYVSAACSPAAACATTYLACDSVHECPANMVCCASTNGGSSVWAASQCKTACLFPQRQLCDGPDECDGGCSAVSPSIRPPNLRACPG